MPYSGPWHPVPVFVSYAHEDSEYLDGLRKNLTELESSGLITVWADPDIGAGGDWKSTLMGRLAEAEIVLFLVSESFRKSKFIQEEEVPIAVRRFGAGTVRLIPVVTDSMSIGNEEVVAKYKALPVDVHNNLLPIRLWPDRDEAFAQIKEAVHAAASDLRQRRMRRGWPGNVRTNLFAAEVDALWGREPLLDDVVKALLSSNPQALVTIVGREGVGRSALARAAAKRSLERSTAEPEHSDSFEAVVWCSTQDTTPAAAYAAESRPRKWGMDDLFVTVADTLRDPKLLGTPYPDRFSVLAALLEERRCLLVVDDADQVLDRRCKDLFRSLRGPSKVLLIGSERLGLGGADFEAAPLDEKDVLAFLDGKAAPLSVLAALPRDRRQLADLAGGLPTVLQWALGMLADSGKPLAWINGLLSRAGTRWLPEYCVHLSVKRLAPVEHRLLLAFALFPQPTRPSTAAAVAGITEADLGAVVARLERLRLVRSLDGGTDEVTRCRVRARARRYAALLIDQDPAWKDSAIREAVEQMRGLARTARDLPDQEQRDGLAAEVGNVLWAAEHAYSRDRWDVVLDFRNLLHDFLFERGFWNEGIELGKWAFYAADLLNDQRERGWIALYPLQRLYFYQGRYDQAERLCGLALEVFRRAEYPLGMASAERNLGRIAESRGDVERAEQLFRSGLRRMEHDSHNRIYGHLLAGVASVAERDDEAMDLYARALGIYEETGDQIGVGTMHHSLGVLACRGGLLDEAEERFNEALGALARADWVDRRVQVIRSQAQLAQKRGDLARARRLLEGARDQLEGRPFGDEAASVENALEHVRSLERSRGPG